MNIFEKASRENLTFSTSRGLFTVSDLWQLPLTSSTGKVNLNDLAVGVFKTLDSTPTVSFVEDAPIVDQTNQLRLDVLKHIICVIKTERDAAAAAASKKETKQKILEIIAKKQDDALSNKSVDELKAMLETV